MTPSASSVARSEVIAIGPEVTNGGKALIEYAIPYTASARVVGVADLIFHRWNCDSVATKAGAAKGSKAKKTDDLESYVYRDDDGGLAVPGEYLRQSIINAAKFRQDPRSPRKSAMDLYKAGVVSLTPLAPLGARAWDYEDRRRVTVQRAGITRVRPAMKLGWSIEVQLLVTLPEYIPPDALQDVLVNAGRLVGVGDNRPTYGRFAIRSFEVFAADWRRGGSGSGWARLGRARSGGGAVWLVEAGRGRVRFGLAWWGSTRYGKVGLGGARHGKGIYGVVTTTYAPDR